MYIKLPKLRLSPVLLIIVVITSCQREITITDINSVHDYVRDSTLLIKSVTLYENSLTPDTIVETYSYDSINRKITLTWNDPTASNFPDGTMAELSYNSNWMISHAKYIYPAGYTPQAWDYNTIDVVYDAEKILQKITVNYSDGSVESKVYTKTSLASGNYQLSWDESNQGLPDDRVLRRAVFNADGKNIISVVEHSFIAATSPGGDDIFTNYITSDTLFYDAAGNISKIIRNERDTLLHTSQSFVSYNFSVRQTRGDQLYNQRQAIMRGIANMPFFDHDSDSDLFGILAYSLGNEQWQYLKYPVQTADIHWLGSDYHFIALSEFDSMNRLTKFKGFALDIGLIERVFKIKYYK
jgi:hypothetical protein